MAVEIRPITEADLLVEVKKRLGDPPAQLDGTLTAYIEDVKGFLASAGVSDEVIGSTLAVGCISRGVADLWNYGNGDTQLSEFFFQRAAQLRGAKSGGADTVSVRLLGSVVKRSFVVQEETAMLTIGIEGFAYATDSLSLYVNGLKFDESRYKVVDNDTIRLALPVIAGTAIEFVVTKLERA